MNIATKSSILLIILASVCVSPDAFGKSKNRFTAEMSAYDQGDLVTVNVKEMPAKASKKLIKHNKNVSHIYTSNDLDTESQAFVPVFDSSPGSKKKANPHHIQVIYTFNEGFLPRQFTTVEEIQAAAAAQDPEITLDVTDEVYLVK